MGYTRSSADPCLYFRWDEHGELCVWLTWIDDCIIVGSNQVVDRERRKMMQLFECDDVGPMEEYVRNKIEMSERKMKLTQSVLLQSFADEFGVRSRVKTYQRSQDIFCPRAKKKTCWVQKHRRSIDLELGNCGT
jgi:hypothetical protein